MSETAVQRVLETFEDRIVGALRDQSPVVGLTGVRILDVTKKPSELFDVSFRIEWGASRVPVFAEFHEALTPKILDGIAPWIARLKAVQPEAAFAVIAPSISHQTQEYCIQRGVDFLDLAGNIAINVPGGFVLRRLGMKGEKAREVAQDQRILDIFSGRSSRVLRVLLRKRKTWTLKGIAAELVAETRAWNRPELDFQVSLGTISKVLSTLEQEMLIRRQNSNIVVPDLRLLLARWTEKYKERSRARLRRSRTKPNPYISLDAFTMSAPPSLLSVTGPAAGFFKRIPLSAVDVIETFVLPGGEPRLPDGPGKVDSGPNLRISDAYDAGVFMYARPVGNVFLVSDVQCYLDLCARGGRDVKQAEYLLEKSIVPGWNSVD
jgi:hypothetical protein